MFRVFLLCSLAGCGLILDLDPPERDSTRPDVGAGDVGPSLDAYTDVAKDTDPTFVDSAHATDAMVLQHDAGEHDAGEHDAGEPDAGPIVSCAFDDDCGETTECRSWTCDSGTCRQTNAESGTLCSEDLYCTIGMMCRDGECSGGEPRVCPGEGDLCTVDVCSESERTCLRTPVEEGTECDVLNGAGFCIEGSCEIHSCREGFADCGETAECTNINESRRHCGGCGNTCGALLCILGICL